MRRSGIQGFHPFTTSVCVPVCALCPGPNNKMPGPLSRPGIMVCRLRWIPGQARDDTANRCETGLLAALAPARALLAALAESAVAHGAFTLGPAVLGAGL